MHRHVPDEHRVIWELRVEIVPSQPDAIGHGILVVPVRLDQFTLRDLVSIAELRELDNDAGGVLARPGRRRVDVDLIGHCQRAEVVAVGVDEAGQ